MCIRDRLLRIKYSEEIEQKMRAFFETLNEKDRRRYAAIEAIKLGHGDKSICVACLDVISRLSWLELMRSLMVQIYQKKGSEKLVGGRKKIIETEENIDEVFFEILNHHTAGSPIDAEIKWTNLSLKEISKAFESKGMNISPRVVKQLLKKHGFVERKMQKAVTMKDCKDRNEQFERIHELKEEYSKSENPIISMDVKKRVFR